MDDCTDRRSISLAGWSAKKSMYLCCLQSLQLCSRSSFSLRDLLNFFRLSEQNGFHHFNGTLPKMSASRLRSIPLRNHRIKHLTLAGACDPSSPNFRIRVGNSIACSNLLLDATPPVGVLLFSCRRSRVQKPVISLMPPKPVCFSFIS